MPLGHLNEYPKPDDKVGISFWHPLEKWPNHSLAGKFQGRNFCGGLSWPVALIGSPLPPPPPPRPAAKAEVGIEGASPKP